MRSRRLLEKNGLTRNWDIEFAEESMMMRLLGRKSDNRIVFLWVEML